MSIVSWNDDYYFFAVSLLDIGFVNTTLYMLLFFGLIKRKERTCMGKMAIVIESLVSSPVTLYV